MRSSVKAIAYRIQVETMIDVFVQKGVRRDEIMYQYSMDIPPGQHWADVWMIGMQESIVCIVMVEEAYLKSKACVSEFLASKRKQQILILCHSEVKEENVRE